MPKLNDTITDQEYFEIDDVPYAKKDWVLSFDQPNGRIAITARYVRTDRIAYLVPPTVFGEYTNQAETPYVSFTALVTAFKTINFF